MYRDKGARPITRASINSRSQIRSKKDKKDWDDRFSIERMPEYNALRDRHCQAYVNMIKRKFKPKPKRIQGQVELAPGRIRKRRIKPLGEGVDEERTGSRRVLHKPPKATGNLKTKHRAAITDEIINSLEEELAKLWDDHQILQFHRDVFEKYLKLLPRDSSAAMMAKEIEDLKKNKAPIQRVMLGITARENCLKEIHEFDAEEITNPDDLVTHKLHSLRMLSLNAVEWIVIWREQMLYAYNQSVTDNNKAPVPAIPFMWESENYLLKIRTDSNFLYSHSLSTFYNFSDKSDPFLVIPSWAHTGVGLKGIKKVRKKQTKKKALKDDHKYEIPLDNSLMQRIRASEIILEKESKGLTSDPSMSPMTNKTVEESPAKSEHKFSSKSVDKQSVNNENVDTNGDGSNSNKRESLFDLRKRNKKPLEDEKTKESAVSPTQSPDKIMTPEDEPKREVIKEIVEDKDEEDMEPEHFEYTLYPLGINEKDAISYLEKYLLKLEDELAKSYANPKDLFAKWMAGNNTQWYGLRNKGSTRDIDGLFVYNLDSHFNRLNVLHLTTINRKGLEAAIDKAMKHIWANESMQEVRVGLYHYDYDKDGKTAKTVDADLRDTLKKKKLRWKNILNEDNDRILVMGGVRTKGEEKNNELDEIFSVKSWVLFNTTDKYPGFGDPSKEKSMFFPSGLYLNSLWQSQIQENEENDQEHHKLLQDILSTINNTNKNQFPHTISAVESNAKDAVTVAHTEKIPIDNSSLPSNSLKYHSNTLSISTKLLSIDYTTHSIESTSYRFLRIKWKDTLIVSAPSVPTQIYFMPIGTHQSFGLLLFKKPKDLRFDSVISLYEYCKDIPSEIQEKGTLQSSSLYLPCFKSEIVSATSSLLKGLQINENEFIDQSIVTNIVQVKDHEAKQASLKFKPEDGDWVIDTDFVFVLTHPELEDQAKIPFMWGLVQRKDFVKAGKAN